MHRRDSGGAGFHDASRKSSNAAFAIIPICGIVAWLWAFGAASGPLGATIQLEHFGASLEHTGSIRPDTARDLGRMLALPQYDCDRIACSADVRARNCAVRARLETLIAMKARRPDTFAAGRDHVIAARSVQGVESR